MNFFVVFIAVLGALLVLHRAGKRKRDADALNGRKTRTQALFDQTRESLAQIQAAEAFPLLETPTVHFEPEEFAILHEKGSTLFGFKSRHVAIGSQARTSVAGISLYPGTWEAESTGNMAAIATGDLYLTNTRLLFVGDSRTIVVAWQNLLSIKATFAGILIHAQDARTPIGFTAKNDLLWAILVRWMSSRQANAPRLPKGTEVILTPGNMNEVEQTVNVTVRSPD